MISDSINWQPSITRSIRGNSSYGFLNQVFNADIDKLKIETSIINKSRQAKILDSILTVIYQENIDDDIFSIPVGDAKPLIRVIENIKSFPFKLLFRNPNLSPLRLIVQKPNLVRNRFRNNGAINDAPPFNFLPSSSQITINNMGVNYGASDPAIAANAVSTTQNLSYVPAAAGVVQVAPATPTRAHGGSITNNSNSDIYISFGATVPAANIGLPLLPKVKSGIPSNIDIPEDYKGQIQAFCVSPANGGAITGGLNVMDFTYL